MNIQNGIGNNIGLGNSIAGHTGNTMAKDEFLIRNRIKWKYGVI